MISVCMATYNGERFIKEQIDSILCQLSPDDELVISDDGSTDRTLEIIASYNDKRIKVLHHRKNPKLAKVKHSRNFYYATENFENALKEAKGDFIFLSDQDDVWLPEKKEKMISAMEESGADCVMCNCQMIDSNGKKIEMNDVRQVQISNSVLRNLSTTPFLGCCMMIRKNALSYILPFPKKCIGHDLWIGTLCASLKKFVFVPKILHQYRIHGDNVSPTVTKQSKNPLWFRITYRIKFIKDFIIRIQKAKSPKEL